MRFSYCHGSVIFAGVDYVTNNPMNDDYLFFKKSRLFIYV